METILHKNEILKKNLEAIKPLNEGFYLQATNRGLPHRQSFKPLDLVEGFDFYLVEGIHFIQNLDSKTVFLFEDDFDKMHYFLSTPEALHFLKSHKLFFVQNNPQLLKKLAWYVACKKFKVVGSKKFVFQIEKAVGSLLANLVDFKEGGAFVFDNFFGNLLHWDHLISFSKMQNLFKHKTCVIVGSGPSLEKNIAVLKKNQDKSFIIAGGSCLKPLLEHQIVPDFLVALDPHTSHIERAKLCQGLHIPTFFNNRVHPGVWEYLVGPKIYLGGVFGFPICTYFEKAFGLDKMDDFGWNIICAAIKIAHCLGFSKMGLVGVDLSYDKKQMAFDAFDDHRDQFLEKGVEAIDLFGNKVTTQLKWLQEKEWIEDYIDTHALHLHNCTQGGLEIKNAAPLSLEAFFQSRQKIDKAIQLPKGIPIQKKQLIILLEELKKQPAGLFLEPLFLAIEPLFYSFEQLFENEPIDLDALKKQFLEEHTINLHKRIDELLEQFSSF
jgi:hypothetical protein